MVIRSISFWARVFTALSLLALTACNKRGGGNNRPQEQCYTQDGRAYPCNNQNGRRYDPRDPRYNDPRYARNDRFERERYERERMMYERDMYDRRSSPRGNPRIRHENLENPRYESRGSSGNSRTSDENVVSVPSRYGRASEGSSGTSIAVVTPDIHSPTSGEMVQRGQEVYRVHTTTGGGASTSAPEQRPQATINGVVIRGQDNSNGNLTSVVPAGAPGGSIVMVPAGGEAAPLAQASGPVTTTVVTDPGAGRRGPGWPAGHRFSGDPLLTGLVDQRQHMFTDYKDDSIIATLVQRMNEQPEGFRQDSEELAQQVKHIEFTFEPTNHQLNLKMVFGFQEGDVIAQFSGVKSGRQNVLSTQSISNDGYVLRAMAICADINEQVCRNAVIVVEQLKENQPCKRIYAVHRSMIDGIGDIHVTMSEEEYQDWNRLAKNPGQRGFLRLFSNSVFNNKLRDGREERVGSGRFRGPYLKSFNATSWAVAYGRAFFELNLYRANRNNERGDLTRFYAPLTKPTVSGRITQVLGMSNDGYRDAEVSQREKINERLSENISAAKLIDNDGRGSLTVEFDFFNFDDRGRRLETVSDARTRLNLSKLELRVLSYEQLLQIVK